MCVRRSLLGSSMGRHWSAIHHLHISHNAPYFPPLPPQYFFFSWVLQPPKGKLKTMLKQNFGGGQIRCIMGDVQVTYWPFFSLSLVTVPEVFAIVNSTQFNFLLVSNVALLQ